MERCLPHLTVLDYSALDVAQKNIQDQLQVKDQQIQELMQSKKEMEILLNEPRKFIDMLEEGISHPIIKEK